LNNIFIEIFKYIFKLNICELCGIACRKQYCNSCNNIVSKLAYEIMEEEDKKIMKLLKEEANKRS
jgi:hypothetical protein